MKLLTRRKLLAAGLTALAGAGTVAYACFVEPYWVEFVRRDLPVAGLPPALDGKTFVQISDIHVGPHVDDDYLVRSFRAVAALEPDVIALTGDFMTSHGTEQLPHVARILRHLPHGRLATLAVLGNHDYSPTWCDDNVADQVACLLETAGVRVLRNEQADVAGLTVVGVDEMWSRNFQPAAALASLAGPAVVLCHNPDAVDRPGWDSYSGWVLSGHTHGGQCKPPFFRPPVNPCENKRYIAGEYDVGGGRRLYINRGLGHVFHARFNARPEVTVFRLSAT